MGLLFINKYCVHFGNIEQFKWFICVFQFIEWHRFDPYNAGIDTYQDALVAHRATKIYFLLALPLNFWSSKRRR
jgi:hypothetical protein